MTDNRYTKNEELEYIVPKNVKHERLNGIIPYGFVIPDFIRYFLTGKTMDVPETFREIWGDFFKTSCLVDINNLEQGKIYIFGDRSINSSQPILTDNVPFFSPRIGFFFCYTQQTRDYLTVNLVNHTTNIEQFLKMDGFVGGYIMPYREQIPITEPFIVGESLPGSGYLCFDLERLITSITAIPTLHELSTLELEGQDKIRRAIENQFYTGDTSHSGGKRKSLKRKSLKRKYCK
jgi:hypothetical protein